MPQRVGPGTPGPSPNAHEFRPRKTMYRRHFKRLFDLVIAMLGLIVASPVMLVVATAVWLFMGRPILYLDRRPGLGERPFMIVKFRTMRLADDPLEIDTHRLTPLGRFLRRTSRMSCPNPGISCAAT